jgi:sulfite dehydrogenase (quinone) subunit SoeB
MEKWNLIVDVPLCENCNNCTLATKDELVGNNFPGYSAPHAAQGPAAISIKRQVRGQAPMVDAAYLPVMCNHCDNAPCLKAAGTDGAIRKREDGIVIIDPIKAKGRRDLVDACPYGAIQWNEAEQLPQHWFFDAHLLDAGWKAPRCVGVCPTGVFEAVKISDQAMTERAQRDNLRVLHPEWGTRPRIYYRGLGRFDECFIGGSVVAQVDSSTDCVAQAHVTLSCNGACIGQMQTDAFGDFKFDGLMTNSGHYEVLAEHPDHGRVLVGAELGESVYLGALLLQNATPQMAARA